MSFLRPRAALVPLALALAALALVVATSGAAGHSKHGKQRFVLRGEATAVDGPCDARGCPVALTGGRFRGAPLAGGGYTAALILKVADQFPNGEGGICAPLEGRIVLGGRRADRVVLGLSGNSCQDGGGPLTGASFTGLARFTVKRGGYGSGTIVLTEDAAKHHRITLIGRIAR